jgi:hypothetical protein
MPNASALLKYATVQMAAESLFGVVSSDTPGTIKGSASLSRANLTAGNRRTSRFTDVVAQEFIDDGWTVVEHKSNTTTGFSGTLFRYDGQTQPARGLVNGESVLSFRSTEFADDSVRDGKATNKLEIQESGWAFGQLADMEHWYKSLRSRGLVSGPLSVTGYSLGGHLATAFNLLRQEEGRSADIAGTYTFNGAGVGTLKFGVRLTEVLRVFELQRRNQTGSEIVFTDARVSTLYSQTSHRLVGGVAPSTAELDTAYELVLGNPLNSQARLLHSALLRVRELMDEVAYLATITNSAASASGDPVRPAAVQIEATKLDYQIAALLAGRSRWF